MRRTISLAACARNVVAVTPLRFVVTGMAVVSATVPPVPPAVTRVSAKPARVASVSRPVYPAKCAAVARAPTAVATATAPPARHALVDSAPVARTGIVLLGRPVVVVCASTSKPTLPTAVVVGLRVAQGKTVAMAPALT